MSNYFGQKTAYQVYVTKIRWIIGTLVALIATLVGGLIIAVQNPNEPLTTTTAEASVAPAVPMGRVIVTKVAVDAGVMLDQSMLEPRELPVSLISANVYPAVELVNLQGRYLKNSLPAGALVSRSDITEIQPINPFQVPAGYRAVTIMVDARTGVEGFAKPTSTVDVLWVYDDTVTKERTIATIVRNVKVLAVGGATTPEAQQVGTQGTFTATLLAPERDAKSIQLAATSGSLTLSLVGEEEPKQEDFNADAVSVNDLLKNRVQKKDPGTCLVKDPGTGRLVKFIFRKNRWMTEEEAAESEAEEG